MGNVAFIETVPQTLHTFELVKPIGREKNWLPPGHQLFFPPFPSELMIAYPVTPKMNEASFNDPAAITPLDPLAELGHS